MEAQETSQLLGKCVLMQMAPHAAEIAATEELDIARLRDLLEGEAGAKIARGVVAEAVSVVFQS